MHINWVTVLEEESLNLRALHHSVLRRRAEHREVREVLEELAVLDAKRGTHVKAANRPLIK